MARIDVLFSVAYVVMATWLGVLCIHESTRGTEGVSGCGVAIQQLARENYLLSSQVEWLRRNRKKP